MVRWISVFVRRQSHVSMVAPACEYSRIRCIAAEDGHGDQCQLRHIPYLRPRFEVAGEAAEFRPQYGKVKARLCLRAGKSATPTLLLPVSCGEHAL